MFVCVCVFVQCGWRWDLQPVRVRSGGRGLQWGRREEAHEADPGGSLLPPPEQCSPPRPEGQRIHTNMFLCCCEVSSDKTSSILWGHVMEKCKNMNSKYMTINTVDTLTNTCQVHVSDDITDYTVQQKMHTFALPERRYTNHTSGFGKSSWCISLTHFWPVDWHFSFTQDQSCHMEKNGYSAPEPWAF